MGAGALPFSEDVDFFEAVDEEREKGLSQRNRELCLDGELEPEGRCMALSSPIEKEGLRARLPTIGSLTPWGGALHSLSSARSSWRFLTLRNRNPVSGGPSALTRCRSNAPAYRRVSSRACMFVGDAGRESRWM